MTEKVIEAIIVGSTEINEKDKMVRAISKDGYFSFFAKGVNSTKSKNAPSLSIFSKSSFTLFESGKGKLSLKTGVLKKTYFSMTSFNEMTICSLLEEISKLFINETSDASTFNILEDSLERISFGEDPIMIGIIFLCTMLKNEGIFSKEILNNSRQELLKIFDSVLTNSTNIEYKKSDLVELILIILDYIEQQFNIKLKMKDLVKII